jgi:hypothetical protein
MPDARNARTDHDHRDDQKVECAHEPSNTDWGAKVRVTVESVIGRVIAGRYEIVRQ